MEIFDWIWFQRLLLFLIRLRGYNLGNQSVLQSYELKLRKRTWNLSFVYPNLKFQVIYSSLTELSEAQLSSIWLKCGNDGLIFFDVFNWNVLSKDANPRHKNDESKDKIRYRFTQIQINWIWDLLLNQQNVS